MARQALEAFENAIDLEAHNLVRWPNLLPQQLFNQLRQADDPALRAADLEDHPSLAGRPWIIDRSPARESALRLTLVGHGDDVTCCDVAPDSSFVLSGSKDTTLKVWDLESGREVATLVGHTETVTDCAISADGNIAVSADYGGMLRVWDLGAAEERSQVSADRVVTFCPVGPDGSFVVSGGYDRTLKIWKLQAGDGRRILDGQEPRVLDPSDEWRCGVSAGTIASDGSLIVSVSTDDHIARLWDVRTGDVLTQVGCPAQPQLDACAISPDGSLVVVGGQGWNQADTLTIWDTATWIERSDLTRGRAVTEFPMFPSMLDAGQISGCAFSPDGEFLVLAAWNLDIWDPRTVRKLASLQGHGGPVAACAVAPNGAFIVSASADRTLKVWNVPRRGARWPPETGRVHVGAIAPDGSFVVTAERAGAVKILDTASREERRTLGRFESGMVEERTCAVSSDGTSIIAGTTGDQTTGLRIWDVATGAVRADLLQDYLGASAVSPDGERIMTLGVDKIVKLWDARTGEPVGKTWGGPEYLAFALSPDWSFIASPSGHSVVVWDLQTGEQRALLEGHTDIVYVCRVSPDGSWIASGGDDGTVRVWDVDEQRALAVLEGHDASIADLAFAPDGSFLVSSGADAARIWDSPMWSERCASAAAGDVAVSPDCAFVVSRTAETLQVLDARACATVAAIPLETHRAALHPWQPSLVVCDVAEQLHFLDLRGVTYGPIVVTPLETGDGPTLRCPACQAVARLDRDLLGGEMACANCGQRLQVNPFVVSPFPRGRVGRRRKR